MIDLLTMKDYDQIKALWQKIDGIGLRSLDDSREGVDKFVKRNPCSNFVYRENDEVKGVILAGHDGRRGYIYHMAVLPEKRKQGIGHDLLHSSLEALKKDGINKVALLVFKDNNIGNSFWEKEGFIQRDDLSYRNKSLNEMNV